MASRTGTAQNLDLTAASGTVGITVPADCTAAILKFHHWDGDSNTTMSSLTINSVAMNPDLNHGEGNPTDTNGYGVFTLKNPATGSQNLAWSWSAGGARDEAGFATITYVKDVDLTDLVRDVGGAAGSDGDNVEVTINSASDDLVLSSCNTFGTPAISGTVYMNNVDGGNGTSQTLVDVAEQTAGASTTTTTMTGESWASMVSISLKNAPALTQEQEGFRFRNDDGSEATATWKAAQDVNASANQGETFRVRILLNTTGDSPAQQVQIEERIKGTPDTSWRKIN